jgi:hypothetical protein
MDSYPTIDVRAATLEDLDAVVALTRARRAELAAWEEFFWRPRAGIDDLHPLYLRWCIEQNPACDVVVATESDVVVGCLFVLDQGHQSFFDDFCVVDQRWADIGSTLMNSRSESPAVLCSPRKDRAQDTWLQGGGAALVSRYFSLPVDSGRVGGAGAGGGHALVTLSEPEPSFDELPTAPIHTFGIIDAVTPGGLRLATPYGYAIGSASLNPPAYDPGGPTTVIDRIVGPQRGTVLEAALSRAANRGDAHVIVVSDEQDSELRGFLIAHGANQPVNVWQRG